MKGTVKLCHRNSVLKQQGFESVAARRTIIEGYKMIYGHRFDEMHLIITLEMSDSLLTNNDGTNIQFGGRHGGRTNGFHYRRK